MLYQAMAASKRYFYNKRQNTKSFSTCELVFKVSIDPSSWPSENDESLISISFNSRPLCAHICLHRAIENNKACLGYEHVSRYLALNAMYFALNAMYWHLSALDM